MARTKQRENYGNGSVSAVMVNKCDKDGKTVMVKKKDKQGHIVRDASGKALMMPAKVQKKDKQGKLVWRVCITLGTEQYVDKNGKLRKRQRKEQRTFHGTLGDARVFCKQLSDKLTKLESTSLGNTFADAVEGWKREMELANTCAPSKLKDYMTRLGYVSPHLSNKPLLEVTALDITAALQTIKNDRNLSQGTIKEAFALVKRVLKRAVAWNWIAANPLEDVKAPTVKDNVERRYLSYDECPVFMQRLDEKEEEAYREYGEKEQRQADWGNTWGRSRLYGLNTLSALVAIRIMAATGMRRGEALGLLWECVDLDNATIMVEHSLNADMVFKGPKTRAGRRTLSIDPVTVVHLKKWKAFQKKALHLVMKEDQQGNKQSMEQTDETPVCCTSEGGFYNPHNLSHWWNKFRVEIGFPTLRMHELRHTQASLLIASGQDLKTVAARLGHDDVTVTINTYSHLIPQRDEEAANFMGSVLYAQPKSASVVTLQKTA